MPLDFEYIIDSHTHWGPSLSMGIEVTTDELLKQKAEAGITHVVIMPFPSTAIETNEINLRLLDETKRVKWFIPYHYIREDFERDGFEPVPDGYFGGKWHWMRGVQDSSSNYKVLNDPKLPGLIERLKATKRPILFEEELSFTERFIEMAEGVTFIIPHLGLLGGDPYRFLESFKGYENVFFDTALAGREQILRFVEVIGPKRVLFASDVPFGYMATELQKVVSLPIPDDEKEFILFRNIIRLTGYNLLG